MGWPLLFKRAAVSSDAASTAATLPPVDMSSDRGEFAINGLDSQLLSRFLQRHFHNGKPVDIISINVKDAVPKGENYTSCVYRVTVSCLLASGRKKSFSMIVKTELKSEVAKENLSALPVFRTETKMYTTVLPLMEDLQEEFGDKRECLWANLYGYVPYKLVAFEDLTDQGYVGTSRRRCLDLNHALLVLRGLARFHAMSKVLLARQLITEGEKGKIAIASPDESMYKAWHAMLTVLSKAMVDAWGEEWEGLSKKVEAQEGVILDKMAAIAATYDKRFEVLNHGDPWTCNVLFRYLEFDALPVSVRFIDFQICHLNSFIWDVEYLINTSVEPKVRREHKSKLLQAYQESLEKNLKLFQYSGYIPTLNDIESESKRMEYASMAIMIISSLMSAETMHAFDVEKLNSHPPDEVVSSTVFSDGKAQAALGEDLLRFAANGII